MFSRLAKKVARLYMTENYPQPLRLQPDYGERNAADFLGDRNVARNTGYGDKLKSGPGNAFDEVVADDLEAEFLSDNTTQVNTGYDGELEADFLAELEASDFLGEEFDAGLDADFEADELEGFEIVDDIGLDRMSDFWKESRFSKGEKGKEEFEDWINEEGREDLKEEWESNTEKYKDVVKDRAKAMSSDDYQELDDEEQELEEKLEDIKDEKEDLVDDASKKAHYEIIDDIGLNRMAKDHEESGSYMSRQNLREIGDMADFIVDDIGMDDLDDWVEDKISHAHSAMNDVARYRGYRDDYPHGEDNFKFASSYFTKDTPFEIVTNWFANAEEASDFQLKYMMGVDGNDEMSGDVEILSGHPVSSIISDLKRDLGRKHNLEFKQSASNTIRWGLPEQSGAFEGEHFRSASSSWVEPSDVLKTLKSLKGALKRGENNVAKLIFDQLRDEVSQMENRSWPPTTRSELAEAKGYRATARKLMDEAFPNYYRFASLKQTENDDIIDDLEW